jgi:tetratricopeptide (TPR) repeat protein
MKRHAVAEGLVLALLGLGLLLAVPGAKGLGQKAETKPDKAASPNGSKLTTSEAAEVAARYETEGQYEEALERYAKLKQSRPRWAAVCFKVAACQVALRQKEEAKKTLRELLALKFAPAALLTQARAALQELELPKLSNERQKDWKQAVALMQAGEELKQHENADLEIRPVHKLSARPYRKAIDLLKKITEESPTFAPAYLSLGIAHENLAHFQEAGEGYRKFLDWGTEKKLAEVEQQTQVRQRMLVCNRRHQADGELAKRIPGKWEASWADEGAPFGGPMRMEFKADGTVAFLSGGTWKVRKGVSWKVVGKQLIVGGDRGRPSEWCYLGPLTPDGQRSEGRTMSLRSAQFVRKSD